MSCNRYSGLVFNELILGGARSGESRLVELWVQVSIIVKACTGKFDLAG